jgi:arginine/lysine/ornithine decarboxylase
VDSVLISQVKGISSSVVNAGIPVVFPGEVLTGEALRYLKSVVDDDGRITGATDSSLTEVMVIVNECGVSSPT